MGATPRILAATVALASAASGLAAQATQTQPALVKTSGSNFFCVGGAGGCLPMW
jgi:hypothetical protein